VPIIGKSPNGFQCNLRWLNLDKPLFLFPFTHNRFVDRINRLNTPLVEVINKKGFYTPPASWNARCIPTNPSPGQQAVLKDAPLFLSAIPEHQAPASTRRLKHYGGRGGSLDFASTASTFQDPFGQV
jgi:hypothetical protein